jgi:signal transduction histidine kinase
VDRSTVETLTKPQLERLLEVGRSLVTDLDVESVLRSVLEAARDLTGARYAALGILDDEKESLDRFLYLGLDDDARRKIGPLPKGRGVLGELIRNPQPLRLAQVGDHPRSYGFPANHPPMTSFVGVPVTIRGEAFGNLYLTDKQGAPEFEQRDEHLLTVLADWAAVAIDNARLYEEADRRRSELERAVQGLEATVSLSRLGTPKATLEWVLEAIAKRGRALVESRWFVLLRPGEGDELVAAEVAGDTPPDLAGASLPDGSGSLRELLGGNPVRRLDSTERLPSALPVGDLPAMLAVMDNRGRTEGFLVAAGPLDRSRFSADDELLLSSFASSAANALTTVTEVERDRLLLSVRSSEQERNRWARELHDETLQQLGAMKLMHETALERDEPEVFRRTVQRAAAEFDDAIESLERLITELRPAALDELGTGAALEALADKVDSTNEIRVEMDVDLAFEAKREPTRHTSELETTMYRIVQEALHNVIKHAEAESVSVSVIENGNLVELAVADDGKGIANGEVRQRFGLRGIRERVELVGGELEIESAPGEGTTVRAALPVTRREAAT